jgi:predicted ATPase/DNA-binding winged helix-turn-helix (wHTH) protein
VSGTPDTHASLTLAFGPFRLIPDRCVLLEGDKPCRLGSRTMELLLALVERAGETVSKQELLDRAWPGMTVDDANLRVHLAALRKALGDGQSGARYIVNVMGRGYCFVAPVVRTHQLADEPEALRATARLHNLPALLARVVGRAGAIDSIALQVPMRRCVTIVGPGGIGKTTTAIMAAEKLLPVFDDGTWFVDLATITDRQLIPVLMASVLGFSLPLANPVESLVAFLHDKRLLLLLDNCEHVVDAIAPLAETILQRAPQVSILATSREALRTAGEWVYHLKPMATPPVSDSLTAAEALAFPAVQLFVERASASLDGFELTDENAAVVAELCRSLDGLALAIELTAARIDLFGLQGLLTVLNDQFLLLSEGPRTVMPRQQSLLATLEWSYRLLSETEQAVLCRLSAFRGDFTLDAAVAVAGDAAIGAEMVYAGVLSLSMKSLVVTDVTGETPHHHHRLLHVTRAFIARKLHESGESDHVARRHADYLCRLLEQAEADWEVLERKQWLQTYARTIDDVRAALDWAFSPAGDTAIGVTLSALALQLAFQLSLIDELRTWVERALLHASLLAPPRPLPEMRLNVAMVRLSHNIAVPVAGKPLGFERARELSLQLDNVIHQTAPLIAEAANRLGSANYADAVELAGQASAIAEQSGNPKALLGVNRVAAQAYHFNGDHATARRLATQVLENSMAQIPLAFNSMPVDRRVSMRVVLARIAWLQGWPETATRLAGEAMDLAAGDGAFSLCQVLVLAAIPIALWSGDDAAADGLATTLAEQANRYSLANWGNWAPAFRSVLRVRAGFSAEPPKLTGALQLDTFTTFSVDHLVPATILRAQNGEAGWSEPEIHRAQGESLLAHGSRGAADAAEALFQRALDMARRQEALAWELRAAMSLARLWKQRGRVEEGRTLLAGFASRFIEGHRTTDLMQAAELLASLAPAGGAARQGARRRATERPRAR